ncbi:MAG: exo-alpha-sialidase [Candidatus Omnitrophica bacterium]|nr:exo-alpha-sialidase [Candidatus Omnitrophota bacterium]
MDKEIRKLEQRLEKLGEALIDQKKARVIIESYRREKGFWFGGGKLIRDKQSRLILSGRYRNAGDSRYGLEAGERGLELAVFVSRDQGLSFQKILSWGKKDLANGGKEVISIEGSCLYLAKDRVWLFVSLEKKLGYPASVKEYQKPGTGIWEVDVFSGETIEKLNAAEIRTVLSSLRPERLHIKDPVVFDLNKQTYMFYCQHPFSWTCSYTGLARLRNNMEVQEIVSEDVLPRGYCWDVAVCRLTCRVPVPRVGFLRELPPVSLYFYDGAECMREHPQSEKGIVRPRGFSCEEISGLAWGFDEKFPEIYRLSLHFPFFVSDQGTGCSRYISATGSEDGLFACWQKSMADFSQPLVFHTLNRKEIEEILK